MITVKGRALIIPTDERQIGTTYDNNAEVRRFRIDRVTPGGIDLTNLTYKLDLEYAGQIKDTSLLGKEITEDSIILEWTVPAACVAAPGTVWIAIRGFDDYGTVKWATNKGTVYVFDTVNTPGTYTGNLTEMEQLESSITQKLELLDQNEGTRQRQESERQTNTQNAIDRANNAATGLEEAIDRANNAAVGVEEAIDRVNDAAIGVEEATQAANNAASSVSEVKDQAITATQAANNAASSISEVKNQAIAAAQEANTAAAGALSAKEQAIISAQEANTAAAGALSAKGQAITSAQEANTAATGAIGAKEAADTAAQAANTAAIDVTAAKEQALSAAQEANTAATGAIGAKNQAESAAQEAETAATNAESNSLYAKEQGDYAKEQGDAAKAALLGDLSEKTIDIFTPSTETFPMPEQGEKLSVIFGKLLKSMTDWFTLKSEILLKSMIVNHFAQTEAGGVADARLAKILNDRIGNTSNLPSGTTDLVNAITQLNSNLANVSSNLTALKNKAPIDLSYITSFVPRIHDFNGTGQSAVLRDDITYMVTEKGILTGAFGYADILYTDRPTGTSKWGYVEYFKHADSSVTVKIYPEDSVAFYVSRFVLGQSMWLTAWRQIQLQ